MNQLSCEEKFTTDTLKARVETFIEELKSTSFRDRSAREIIARLEACLSEEGPRLPPFTWTQEQVNKLKFRTKVMVHWHNAGPSMCEILDRKDTPSMAGPYLLFREGGWCQDLARLDPESLVLP